MSEHTHQPDSGRTRELPMARSMCWHCQSEMSGEYFCGRCVKVQPLSKELDYFTCLNLPRKLNIDEKALEETFYALSRSFHPDYFATKDEGEKAISLGNTALLNTAYRTLKDPMQRAEYLIRLEAGSAKDIRTSPPADLFDEILELQEDLDEFRSLSAEASAERRQELLEKLQADRLDARSEKSANGKSIAGAVQPMGRPASRRRFRRSGAERRGAHGHAGNFIEPHVRQEYRE